jgi:N-acetylmuramoyl-L-alanine amidase
MPIADLVLAAAMSVSPVQMECLAKNAYFEARNQSHTGAVAVSQVVLNRVASKRYPNTICEVITQGKKTSSGKLIRNRCQFSWYCDGLSDWPRDKQAWERAKKSAAEAVALYDVGFDLTDGATHYHAKTVKPRWSYKLDYLMQIDDHRFYLEE